MRRVALCILGLIALVAAGAPALTPHDPHQPFRESLFGPPMRPHVIDDDGAWHAPFVYPQRLVNRLERRYAEDRSIRIPLVWFSRGVVVRAADETRGPWLPLGADSFGRDVFARLVYGARLSLGLAVAAVVLTLIAGVLLGAIAGYAGGLADEAIMRAADFVIVLPAIYVALALRSVMPLVLPPSTVFVLVTAILSLVGWPFVARAVRAVIVTERRKEYAAAAQSLGAGHLRLLGRHLMPACTGVVLTQAALLLPAFILAEATLSYVGLGFSDQTASWGSMLYEASNVTVLSTFPWTLAPAAAIFIVVLAVNLAIENLSPLAARLQPLSRLSPPASRL
jgi:peptide/nickel transport system permease protein